MESLVIQKFPFGRDTRRSVLTSQPGTLVTANNTIINEGGEIEGRKAFVLDADVSVLDSNGDQGTFGFEVLTAGKTVFGSALPFEKGYTGTSANVSALTGTGLGGIFHITVVNGVVTAITSITDGGSGYAVNDYVTLTSFVSSGCLIKVTGVSSGAITTVSLIRGQRQGQPVLVSAMPSGYTYQQLQHPAIYDAGTIDGFCGDASVAVTNSQAPKINGSTGRGYHGFDGISDTGKADLGTADAVNYDRTKHRLTKIVFSNSYNGKSFVCAQFSDGIICLYYDGVFVRQSYTGIISSSYTTDRNRPISIAYNIAAELNALTGWVAQVNPADTTIPDGSPALTSRNYYAPCRVGVPGTGDPISAMIPSRTSTVAITEAIFQAFAKPSSSVAATVGQTATFVVTKSSGTPVYRASSSIPLSGETAFSAFNYKIMADVAWATSDINTAGLIATAINLLTSVTGLSATNGGTATVTVTLANPSSPLFGTTPANNVLVAIVSGGTDSTAAGTHAFSTGQYTTGFAQTAKVVVDGASSPVWAIGDTWSISIVHATQGDITVGAGNISNQSFNFALKMGDREFLSFGGTWAFSDVGDPTGWEIQNPGADTVSYITEFGSQDTVQGFAPYQGNLAVLARQSIQIWVTNADPNLFARKQILPNIGTESGFSIQNYGELDIFFVASSGFRSLRVRDQSLNAMVVDIGTPINSLIKAYTPTERAGCLSTMEPDLHRYWGFIKDTIHVLSYFPDLKIQAWSAFSPTVCVDLLAGLSYDLAGALPAVSVTPGQTYLYQRNDVTSNLTDGGLTYSKTQPIVAVSSTLGGTGVPNTSVTDNLWSYVSFTPEKFVVYLGQIYVRATNGKVYVYGGANNLTYDATLLNAELPWLDHGKPITKKESASFDGLVTGQWVVKASMDPRTYKNTGALTTVATIGSSSAPAVERDSTEYEGLFPYSSIGTRIKLVLQGFTTDTTTPAKISSLIWRYNALTKAQ